MSGNIVKNEPILSRKYLTISVSIFFLIGLGIVLAVLMGSMGPSKKAISSPTAPVKVNVSDLKVGEFRNVEWQEKPIIILPRDPENIPELWKNETEYYDPYSTIDPDPKYIRTIQRSIHPEYFVALNISTYCGCSLIYQDSLQYKKYYKDFVPPGGVFFDPCHIGAYDVAGRLLKKTAVKPVSQCSERMSNMIIPPHRFVAKNTNVIGLEPGMSYQSE